MSGAEEACFYTGTDKARRVLLVDGEMPGPATRALRHYHHIK
jgi:hypothetical protein